MISNCIKSFKHQIKLPLFNMTCGTFFTIKGLKQGLDWIVSSSVHIMRKPSAVWGDVRNTDISQMQILALAFLIRFSFLWQNYTHSKYKSFIFRGHSQSCNCHLKIKRSSLRCETFQKRKQSEKNAVTIY